MSRFESEKRNGSSWAIPRENKEEIEMNKTSEPNVTKHQFDAFFKPVLGQLQKTIPSYQDRILDCPFPVWKTITIGGKTPRELYEEPTTNGIRFYNSAAKHILCNNILTTRLELQRIALVRTTFLDIGFTEQPTREEFVERFLAFGLERCPAETIPHLMSQYPNEQYSLEITVVMEPISFSNYSLPNYDVFLEVVDNAGNRVPWRYTDVPEYIDTVVFKPVCFKETHSPRLATDGEYDGESITWKPDHELIFACAAK
jgi:hypothetical protein